MTRIRPAWTPESIDTDSSARTLGFDFANDVPITCDGLWWYHAATAPLSPFVNAYLYQTAGQVLVASTLGFSTAGWATNTWHFVPFDVPYEAAPGTYTLVAGILGGLTFDANDLAVNIPDASGHVVALAHTGRFANGTSTAFPTNTWDGMFGMDLEFELGGSELAATMDAPLGGLTATMAAVTFTPDVCPPTAGFFIDLTMSGVIPLVSGLMNCVTGALDQTPDGVPCRQVIVPSAQIAWDNCGPCVSTGDCGHPGQVAMAVLGVYGSEIFPSPMATKTWSKCGPRYSVARILISVTRCLPGMAEDGSPPSAADELAAAITLENDRTAVRQALACCLASARATTPQYVSEYIIGETATYPESGNCGGSSTEILVGIRTDCLCP